MLFLQMFLCCSRDTVCNSWRWGDRSWYFRDRMFHCDNIQRTAAKVSGMFDIWQHCYLHI